MQRRKPAKPLEYYAKKYADRDEAITQAYASGGYGMKEIGDHFGLHYSSVSRILAELRLAKGKPDPYLPLRSRGHAKAKAAFASVRDACRSTLFVRRHPYFSQASKEPQHDRISDAKSKYRDPRALAAR